MNLYNKYTLIECVLYTWYDVVSLRDTQTDKRQSKNFVSYRIIRWCTWYLLLLVSNKNSSSSSSSIGAFEVISRGVFVHPLSYPTTSFQLLFPSLLVSRFQWFYFLMQLGYYYKPSPRPLLSSSDHFFPVSPAAGNNKSWNLCPPFAIPLVPQPINFPS